MARKFIPSSDASELLLTSSYGSMVPVLTAALKTTVLATTTEKTRDLLVSRCLTQLVADAENASSICTYICISYTPQQSFTNGSQDTTPGEP
jgi:hypothetical protein